MTESASEPYQNYHESRFTYDARRDGVWREITKYLQARHIPRDAQVLELGAGYCHFINNIEATERHAIDIFPRVGEFAAPGVTSHVHTCTDLSLFPSGKFQIVFASNLFEHLDLNELSQTCAEVRRVLTPSGRLILLQPNYKYCYRDYFDDYTHKSVFSHLSLVDFLVNEGFGIRSVEPRFMPFSMKSTKLPPNPLLVRLYLHLPYRPFAGQMLVVASRDKS